MARRKNLTREFDSAIDVDFLKNRILHDAFAKLAAEQDAYNEQMGYPANGTTGELPIQEAKYGGRQKYQTGSLRGMQDDQNYLYTDPLEQQKVIQAAIDAAAKAAEEAKAIQISQIDNATIVALEQQLKSADPKIVQAAVDKIDELGITTQQRMDAQTVMNTRPIEKGFAPIPVKQAEQINPYAFPGGFRKDKYRYPLLNPDGTPSSYMNEFDVDNTWTPIVPGEGDESTKKELPEEDPYTTKYKRSMLNVQDRLNADRGYKDTTWDKVGKGMAFAPAALTAIAALQKDKYPKFPHYTPKDLNIDPAINDLINQGQLNTNNVMDRLRSQSGSAGSYMTNAITASGQGQENTAKAIMQLRLEAAARNKAATDSAGQFNAQTDKEQILAEEERKGKRWTDAGNALGLAAANLNGMNKENKMNFTAEQAQLDQLAFWKDYYGEYDKDVTKNQTGGKLKFNRRKQYFDFL